MKGKKLLSAIGNISDKHIEGAAPGSFKRKRRFLPYAMAAACLAAFLFGTVFAANIYAKAYVRNSLGEFYLRYLSNEDMAVVNAMAEEYGAQVYFDGLENGDWYSQYVAINKLVEFYNDNEVRLQAISAITPFLANENQRLSEAAAFSLSILKKEFDDPRIIYMADGTIVFTLFNDYSDYGTLNQIWVIKNDELRMLASFDQPKMYIRQILPSPDKRLLAITFVSNKSEYLLIWDLENGRVSPEIIDSARVKIAKDLDIDYWQQIDNENYSDIHFLPSEDSIWDDSGEDKINWVDNNTLEFNASLWFPGTSDDEAIFIYDVLVRFDFQQKQIEYEIVSFARED